MEEEKVSNIQSAPMMSRLLAATIDFGLVLFLSVFGSSLAYRIAQNTNGELKEVISLPNSNVLRSIFLMEHQKPLQSFT